MVSGAPLLELAAPYRGQLSALLATAAGRGASEELRACLVRIDKAADKLSRRITGLARADRDINAAPAPACAAAVDKDNAARAELARLGVVL